MNLFFIDYNLIPLLIQENYLDSMRKDNSLKTLEKMAKSADYISTGDILNKKVRSGMNWKLLTDMALYSTLLPCQTSAVYMGWPKFPQWFSKNSSRRKRTREAREIRMKISK
jgi:replication factor C subunit 1